MLPKGRCENFALCCRIGKILRYAQDDIYFCHFRASGNLVTCENKESHMKVYLQGKNGERVALPDIGLTPPPAGQFLEQTIEGRNLTRDYVSLKTGIPLETLAALLEGEKRFDRNICKKLDLLFPGAEKILLGLQGHNDYYAKHGVVKPYGLLDQVLVAVRTMRREAQPA
jgi:hypothetical protein